MTLKQLLASVMTIPGVRDADHAETIVAAVFQALRDRLTRNEADDVWAQLPTAWKELWASGSWWGKLTARLRGMNHLNREEFIARVQEQISADVPATQAVRVVFHALKAQISPGEADDVAGQLPSDLRTFWKAA